MTGSKWPGGKQIGEWNGQIRLRCHVANWSEFFEFECGIERGCMCMSAFCG